MKPKVWTFEETYDNPVVKREKPQSRIGERVARARKTDPITSHEAAATVNTSPLEQQIIDWLDSHGPQTQKEISLGTGIPEISCSPVLRPMARDGVIYNPTEKRINPGTGKRALAWAVKPLLDIWAI